MTISPYDLDVRPILRQGGEPFGAIMAALADLAPGQPLRLLATFKPVPLFQVMGARGFDASAREIGGGDWEVVFTPVEGAETSRPAARQQPDDSPQDWPEPDFELDLRALDPPEPMVRALEGVESLSAGRTMAALLPREPVFLFEELGARGHQWSGAFLPNDDYRIVIRAGAGGEDGQ